VSGAWRPTTSLTRAVVVGVVAAVYAVVAGNGGVALVALPLLAVSVWAGLTRPTRRPRVSMRAPTPVAAVGSTVRWQIDVEATPGLRDVVATLYTDDGVDTLPAHGHVAAAVAPGAPTGSVAVDGTLAHWGPRHLGPAQVAAFGDLAAWLWQPEETLGCTVAALPEPDTFSSSAPLPHPVGLVGSHRSARPGEGSELADIRPFQTGDRLRRIHWPVSLRTGSLHVTTTYADHDTEVRLLLDASSDAHGPAGPDGTRSGSIDRGVAVAGALAAHYLRAGDRVGLSIHGATAHEVPALGGRQHLHRLLAALALTEPGVGTVRRVRSLRARLARALRPGAVVVVLSPILEGDVLGHAIHLSRTGHHVIVIDTLPAALLDGDPDPGLLAALAPTLAPETARVAWRMRLAERTVERRRCEAAGVPVVRWVGPGSLDAVLRALGRRGHSRTAVAR
jgi:uncharacterized protein (DUF58 family)